MHTDACKTRSYQLDQYLTCKAGVLNTCDVLQAQKYSQNIVLSPKWLPSSAAYAVWRSCIAP